MADQIPNIMKGKFAYYATLPAANDALIAALLKTSGLESDAVLLDKDTMTDIVSGATDEADFGTYARKTLSSVTVTIDDTNNRTDVDAADPSAWTATGSAQGVSKLVVLYDPDTTGGTDADLVPIAICDCVVTFDVGVATTASFNAAGFARAA